MRKIEELERRLRVSSDASEYVLKAPQGIINTANIIRLDSTIADLIDHVLSAESA